MDERLHWLCWVLTPGFGLKRCHQLLDVVDDPRDLFRYAQRWPLPPAIKQTLSDIHRLGEQHPVYRRALEQLRWQEQEDCHLVSLQCPAYPQLLTHIEDPPLMLWVRGNPNLLGQNQVGVVGSRNASLSARKHAQSLGRGISEAGCVVTSGGAAGIDACAHEGALEGSGKTLAVLGCGVDMVYPKQNAGLFSRIIRHGALVSEYPLGTQPKPGHFPRRNRIISGMSGAIVVVEAAERSGSLITADHALEQGREVFALPGDVSNPNTAGCHRLIQDGARLLTGIDDLLGDGALDSLRASPPSAPCPPLDPDLPELQATLLGLLSSEPQPLDVLSDHLECASHTLLEPLLELELAGWIQQQPGGYCRI
ncbi:MAG: DNA-processing protein DprA [Saccharospirillum sp.]